MKHAHTWCEKGFGHVLNRIETQKRLRTQELMQETGAKVYFAELHSP